MRIKCKIDGTLLDSRTIGLIPMHPRFVEDLPDTLLTAKIDVDHAETVSFEIHDFVDQTTGLYYELRIDRVVEDRGRQAIIESWERNKMYCTSGEYHLPQIIDLMVTATPCSAPLGRGRGRPLIGSCTLQVCSPQ
ncbi:MAG: hypothetical protein AAGF11_02115 [Myxococcota bacterium]